MLNLCVPYILKGERKIHISVNIGDQKEDVICVVNEARKIIDTLDIEMIDLSKSRIYEDEGVHFEVCPVSEKAMGVYMCIRTAEDIAAGALGGSHVHFNSEHYAKDFSSIALEHFRKLLHSKQYIKEKFRKGRLYSFEVLFKQDGEVISSFESTESLTGFFGVTTVEESEFSFL